VLSLRQGDGAIDHLAERVLMPGVSVEVNEPDDHAIPFHDSVCHDAILRFGLSVERTIRSTSYPTLLVLFVSGVRVSVILASANAGTEILHLSTFRATENVNAIELGTVCNSGNDGSVDFFPVMLTGRLYKVADFSAFLTFLFLLAK